MQRANLWKQLKQIALQQNVTLTLQYRNSNVQKLKDEIERIRSTSNKSISLSQNKYHSWEENKDLAEKIIKKIQDIPLGSVLNLNGQSFIHSSLGKTTHHIIDLLPYDDDDKAIQQLLTLQYSNHVVPKSNRKQVFRIGEVNCFINPVKLQLIDKMEKANNKTTINFYKNALTKISTLEQRFEIEGAHSDLIQELCDIASFKFKIRELLSGETTKYKTTKVPKARWQFNFLNVRFNHVELWQGKDEKIEVIYDNEEMTAQQTINEIAHSLIYNQNSFTFSKHNKEDYRWIKAGNIKYIEQSYNRYITAEQEMKNYVSDLSLCLSHDQIRLLQQFCNVSGNILLQPYQNHDDIKHIDIVKGYSICAKISDKYREHQIDDRYNLGVPILTQLRRCDKNFALQHNGLYIIDIDWSSAPWYVINILKDLRKFQFVIMPIIKLLDDLNVKFEVIGGFYGHQSKLLEYKDEWIETKAYYKFPSKCLIYDGENKKILQNAFIGQEEFAEIIANNKNVIKSKTQGIYHLVQEQKSKPYQHTLIHYGAFVLQYQQLALMLQLKEMKQELVIGMIGDDIYYRDHSYNRKSYFEIKEINKCDLISWCNYKFINNVHSSTYDLDLQLLGDERKYAITEIHIAPGGFGKSHHILNDRGNINLIYLTLTNDLVEQQKKQHGIKANTKDLFISKLSNRQYKSIPSCIVIDEIGLTGDGIIQKLKRDLPQCILYCLGDDLQLQNNLGQQYDLQNYDAIYNEEYYQTDYRSKDPKLTKLKQEIRQWMRNGMQERDIFNRLLYRIDNITIDKMTDLYQSSTDIITTHSNKMKDKFTEKLKHKDPKYRVTKYFKHNDRDYFTGQIITGHQEFQNSSLNLQHAFTCHSLQGTTHHGKMFISKPINHDIFRGYCYTAVSRCVYLEQLYLIWDIGV